MTDLRSIITAFVIVCGLIVLPASSAGAQETAPIIGASLKLGGMGTSETPLALTGKFASNGKSFTFALDILIDTQDRGSHLRRVPRIKLVEVNNVVREQAVDIAIVSYYKPDVLMWGPKRDLSGIDDETFSFSSFVKGVIIAIDEAGLEHRIIGFTLFPKVTGAELVAPISHPRFVPPMPTWANFIVYPDGALQSLDSTQ